jgi:hypothetical protein
MGYRRNGETEEKAANTKEGGISEEEKRQFPHHFSV